MKRCRFYMSFFFVFSPLLSLAQTVSPSVKLLADEVETLKKDACLKGASWGLCVAESETGKQLYSYNSELLLEPASVIKIVTTGAALSILGASYTFETRLEYSGAISTDGTLNGNLYIKGSGDPTIGSKRFGPAASPDSVFAEFYSALQRNHISRIKGFIVADASVFGESPAAGSWLWEDIGNYYASGAYGLNLNENAYRLYFDAGPSVGSPAKLAKIEPAMDNITFINNVKTASAGTGDNVIIYGQPYTGLRMLEGTVPLGKTAFDVDGSLPDPPRYLAEMFYKYLKNKVLIADSAVITSRELKWSGKEDTAKRMLLISHSSPPLSDIINHTNTKSVNLFAEAILKAIGKKINNEGSEYAGIRAVISFWKSKNIDLEGFEMEDACGLSRKNKINTRQLCGMLSAVSKEKYFDALSQSLPIAGKTGGMASLLKNTPAENNLRAKTGNMDQIKSYAGYVKDSGGKMLTFALIFNNFTCTNAEMKQKAEKLLLLITRIK